MWWKPFSQTQNMGSCSPKGGVSSAFFGLLGTRCSHRFSRARQLPRAMQICNGAMPAACISRIRLYAHDKKDQQVLVMFRSCRGQQCPLAIM